MILVLPLIKFSKEIQLSLSGAMGHNLLQKTKRHLYVKFYTKRKVAGGIELPTPCKPSYEILVAYSCFMYIKLFILHISAYSLKQVKGVEHKGFEPGGMAQHCLCTNHSVNGVFINLFMTKLKYIVFLIISLGRLAKTVFLGGNAYFLTQTRY